MKTSYILIAVGIAVVVIGGMLLLRGEEENMTPPLTEQSQSSLTVTYSDEGYSPKELKIQKGEVVTFTNESSQLMWTASAIHPSHGVYPGTSIQKCSSAPAGEMFESCAGTSAGESWTFQFNETGSWGYHNHLRPTHTGKIIVE